MSKNTSFTVTPYVVRPSIIMLSAHNHCLKPLSVTTNVVGLQIDDVGHVDAVVVTETHFIKNISKGMETE